MPGTFDDIIKGINAAIPIIKTIGGGGGVPKPPKPLTDSGKIAVALDNMWLNVHNPAVGTKTPDELMALDASLIQWLNDPTVFKQGGTENDAYINNSKNNLNAELISLQAAKANAAQTQIQAAQVQAVANNLNVGGVSISPTMLVVGGGMIVALILVTKK